MLRLFISKNNERGFPGEWRMYTIDIKAYVMRVA